jgi:hypothetical protein
MSEETTQNISNNGSFEERVFARFDAIDARLQALEIQAEQRALETKSIWERALAGNNRGQRAARFFRTAFKTDSAKV